MHAPTENEIDEVLNQCMEAFDAGSRWPGATFEQGGASMRPRLIAVDDSPSRNRLFLLKIWRFLRGLCAHTFLRVRVKQNSTRQLGEMLHVFNSLRRCERWPRQCLALERSRPLGGKERGLGGVRR